jgi:hypothetical protein
VRRSKFQKKDVFLTGLLEATAKAFDEKSQ